MNLTSNNNSIISKCFLRSGHIFRTCGYCQKILIFERYEMD